MARPALRWALAAIVAAGNLQAAGPVVRTSSAYPVRVLLIGDSLSVGPFGQALEESLKRRYGARGYCVFASCGSSPEDWLRGRPVFTTRCGYRQVTPAGSFVREYSGGRRPPPVRTPKLPAIFARFRPELVIVQLGTNWMEKVAASARPDGDAYRRIIRDFIRELRSAPGPPPRIVWVMPPASSAYPVRVHAEVETWITESARTLGFSVINSRKITGPYRRGETGGDGVHYSGPAGRAWARGVWAGIAGEPSRLPLGGGGR
jgi:hypothetical protein